MAAVSLAGMSGVSMVKVMVMRWWWSPDDVLSAVFARIPMRCLPE
jgi:hypothetical protein